MLLALRNRVIGFVYKNALKPLFFRVNPETIHDHMVRVGKLLGRYGISRYFTKALFSYQHPSLEQTLLGIHFKNPIGLAAGFDKNAELTDIMPAVGFGFQEVGSITGEACIGNQKPRLWRLKSSQALVVNYGLKNDGCEAIARRLRPKHFALPIGTNIAKTNCAQTCELDEGIADYVKAFSQFTAIGAYFTINISCPNAFGGQPFTEPARLDALLTQLDEIVTPKPIFLKLSPDISEENLEHILDVAMRHRIHGFICSNLTKNRDTPLIKEHPLPEQGGISGKVVEPLANKLIADVYRHTKGKYIIIGCGGVFSADDAYRKIKLGASLVQLITGMIFEGPQLISSINQGLVALLKRDGFSTIAEAVGKDHSHI